MLEKELETYSKEKASLQLQYPDGGYVVINGDEVLGVWQTRGDALRAGIEKYGNVQFLVKDIMERNIAANFSRDFKLV
jgi:hypothetical protein